MVFFSFSTAKPQNLLDCKTSPAMLSRGRKKESNQRKKETSLYNIIRALFFLSLLYSPKRERKKKVKRKKRERKTA